MFKPESQNSCFYHVNNYKTHKELRDSMQANKIKTISEMLSVLAKLQFQFGHNSKGNCFAFRGHQEALYTLMPSIYRNFRETQQARLMMQNIMGQSILQTRMRFWRISKRKPLAY